MITLTVEIREQYFLKLIPGKNISRSNKFMKELNKVQAETFNSE